MNILIVSTEEYLTLRLLKCLAGRDNAVHVWEASGGQALRASRHCRRHRAFDCAALEYPTGPLCAEIDRYCRRHAIDIVLPSGMAAGFFLAACQANWPAATLPVPSFELLQTLNNKWRFSRLLEQHGLPFPESRLIVREEDAQAVPLPFPVIVKPLELDAGRGVARCNSQSELAAHVRRHRASLPLLVQEYIPGEDVGLGLLARAGEVLASTIQRQLPDSSGVEFIRHDGILDIGRQIMSVCNYEGIAHFDLRLDSRDGSVKVLECNPRFWASLPFCMVAGVNFAELGMRLALNLPLPDTSCRNVSLTFPTKVLSGAMRGRAQRLSEPSRAALRFTLSDPVPNLLIGAGRMRRKVGSLFLNAHEEVC